MSPSASAPPSAIFGLLRLHRQLTAALSAVEYGRTLLAPSDGERTIRANDFALLWPNHERRPSAHKRPTESRPLQERSGQGRPRIDSDGVPSQPGEAELYGTSASTTACRARAAGCPRVAATRAAASGVSAQARGG